MHTCNCRRSALTFFISHLEAGLGFVKFSHTARQNHQGSENISHSASLKPWLTRSRRRRDPERQRNSFSNNPRLSPRPPEYTAKMSMFRAKKLDLGCFTNIKIIRDHSKRKAYEAAEAERY